MNENMLAILVYIIGKHAQHGHEVELEKELLIDELEELGFKPLAIDCAFRWLNRLRLSREAILNRQQFAISEHPRVFANYECQRFDEESRGLILFLESAGILNPLTRELVIDCLLAIEDNIEPIDVKMAILLVLLYEPEGKSALAYIQKLIVRNSTDRCH